jgi:hypothetical protein
MENLCWSILLNINLTSRKNLDRKKKMAKEKRGGRRERERE